MSVTTKLHNNSEFYFVQAYHSENLQEWRKIILYKTDYKRFIS